MAGGWAKDCAVQDQIDASVSDAVQHARNQLATGDSLAHCQECEADIPKARQEAVTGVRLCISCQEQQDKQTKQHQGINRSASKDSQLR